MTDQPAPDGSAPPPAAAASPPPLAPGCVATLRDVAVAAGKTAKTVSEWKSDPAFPIEPDGSFSVWKICAWRLGKTIARLEQQRGQADDELLAGGDSPALEAYRWKKAAMAGLELEEKRKNLVARDKIREGMIALASVRRRVNDSLQRQFGIEAHKLIEDGLRDERILIDSLFGPTNDDAGEPEPGDDQSGAGAGSLGQPGHAPH